MNIREYKEEDMKDLIRIWNEVVEEGGLVLSRSGPFPRGSE